MLCLDNVSIGYRAGANILIDVTFKLLTGTCAICGPNGSGKTTLLRTMAGVLRPVSGTVTIDGVNVYDDPRGKRRVGYLPHRPSLYPDLTVAENLEYWGRVSGLARKDILDASQDVRERLHLGELWEKPAGQLSRGQKQRVALARTLLHQPRLLVLDEPTTGFDLEAQDAFSALLRLLRDSDHMIVFSTHRSSEVKTIAARLLTVESGDVVLHDKMKDVALTTV